MLCELLVFDKLINEISLLDGHTLIPSQIMAQASDHMKQYCYGKVGGFRLEQSHGYC